MKNFKEERSKEEEVTPSVGEAKQSENSEKDSLGKKSHWKGLAFALVIIVFVITLALRFYNYGYKSQSNKRSVTELMAETISSIGENVQTASRKLLLATEGEKTVTTVQAESDYYDTYFDGASRMLRLLFLQNNVYQLYKSDGITKEQAEEYFSSSNNIIYLALSDNEIPDEEIEKYNDIIETIPFIDYQNFQLKSSGSNFQRGLRGHLKAESYWQIVDFYQAKIPEEKYNTFKMIVGLNLNHYEEENDVKIIEYGEKLIKTYIGDVEEVLTSNKWKNDISIE